MKYVFLLIIISVAFWVRLSGIHHPEIVLQEEQKIGLAASSLLQASPAEVLPLFLRQFGFIDISTVSPVSIFVTVPWIRMMGFTPVAVRLPAILFGCISILCFFLLAKRVSGKSPFALTAAAFLAVSPWHIQLSRVDVGLMIGLVLFLTGCIFCVSTKKHPKFLYIISVLFAGAILADYSYAIPITCIYLTTMILCIKRSWVTVAEMVVSACIFVVILLPFFQQVKTYVTSIDRSNAALRFISLDQSKYRIQQNENSLRSNIFFYPGIADLKYYLGNALQYTELTRLFFAWNFSPGFIDTRVGLFHVVDIFLILIGLSVIIKKKPALIVLGGILGLVLILSGIYQASSPDPTRLFIFIVPAVLTIALGGTTVCEYIHKKRIGKASAVVLVMIILYSFSRSVYAIAHPQLPIPDFYTEYRQAFTTVDLYHSLGYKTVIVDVTYGHDLPLYWISLANRQNQLLDYIRSGTVSVFDTYSFIHQPPDAYTPGTIYIQPMNTVPKGFVPSAVIGNDEFRLAIIIKTEDAL